MSDVSTVGSFQFGFDELLRSAMREEVSGVLREELSALLNAARLGGPDAGVATPVADTKPVEPEVSLPPRLHPVEPHIERAPGESEADYRARLRSNRAAKAAKTRSLNAAEEKRAAREALLRDAYPESIISPGAVSWDEAHKTSVIEWPTEAHRATAAESAGHAYPSTAHEDLDLDVEEAAAPVAIRDRVIGTGDDDLPAASADLAARKDLSADEQERVKELLSERCWGEGKPYTNKDLREAIAEVIAARAPEPEPVASPAPEPAPVPVPCIYSGKDWDRVLREAARPGPVLLVGQTAVGKTTMPMAAARLFDARLNLLSMEPGYTSDNTYGQQVSVAGAWTWRDGPICTWAREAAAGTPSWLIIDELARGPRTTVSEILPILNLYTAQQVLDLGHTIAWHAPEPYHIVRVPLTHEVFVFSASVGKLWATANLGDSYDGLALNDPAFRNRWVAGFHEFQSHSEAQLKSILMNYITPAGGPVLTKTERDNAERIVNCLVATHQGIDELQKRENNLAMTSNLRTLIAWQQEVVRLNGTLSLRDAIKQAAEDLWIDMVLPISGDRTDQDTRTKVMEILAKALPR